MIVFLNQKLVFSLLILLLQSSFSFVENIKRKVGGGGVEGKGVILHFYFYLTFLLAPMMSSSNSYQGIVCVVSSI